MLLLGFSILGSPVFTSLESSEMRDSVEKLEKARREHMKSDCTVSQEKWILSFQNRDEQTEHEAYLALWLSDFVFPDTINRSVSRHVFPVAVRLARGERIALAPAVLASLYRDLGRISATGGGKSLLKLVQVWTWERFKNIRPQAEEIQMGEPRIAQWSFRKMRYDKNERFSFDDFDWRPYAKSLKNWNPPRFYLEEAKWVSVDHSVDDEFVSFARCVRSSPLVGVGFVEDYYPNRVAMQFGLSQDLPGLVTHHNNFTEKESWDDYNKSLDGLKLYIPCRHATTSVTARYRDWWLKSVSEFLSSEELTETFDARNTVGDDASHEVLPLSQVLQKLGEGFPAKFKRSRKLRLPRQMGSEIKKYKTGDCGASVSIEVPLSELAKRTSKHLRNKRCKRAREYDDENRMDCHVDITIAQLIKSRKKTRGGESESPRKSRRREEDNNDLSIFQKLASEDDVTVAPQEIEPRSEENDEQERSEAEAAAVLIPSDENKSWDSPLGGNVGAVENVVSPPEARQNCGCDDEVDVNGINAKKKALVDNGTKEVQCLVDTNGEMQRPNDNDDERSKQTNLDESETLGRRSNFEEDNNGSGIFQKLASQDVETVAPQEIEQRREENDEEETGSKAEKIMVLNPSYGNNSSDPPPCSKEGVVDIVVSPLQARQNCGCDDKVDVNGFNAEKKTMDLRRREEDNNDLRIFQKLSSGDDETVEPQEIQKRNEENGEEETKGEVEEITVLPSLKAGKISVDEVDAIKSNNPENKKTMVDDGTKEAECLLLEDAENQRLNGKEEDERLRQRKLAIEELALNVEARLMKVEKTLATIRNFKTRRNHI